MPSVERGAEPRIPRVQRRLLQMAKALTTPLLPDDYLELLNPMWSPRELRGQVVEVRPEPDDAATVVIRPNARWLGHWPGQYLRIGVEIDGRRHWRAYTLTSDPDHPDGLISVTVKHVPEGQLSPYFTKVIKPDAIVFLGGVEGTFRLPYPRPEKILMISAGSGITPIWSLVRDLARSQHLHDVHHIHCCRSLDHFILGAALRELGEREDGYRLEEHHSDDHGELQAADLDERCPDWREREAFLSGPPAMLDAFVEHWKQHGDPERLHVERFQPRIGGDSAVEPGSGGTIRFRVTDFDAESDGTMPILEAGEAAGAELPFGCRMGVCHTCIGKLAEGRVRDLRTGELHGDAGQMIRTCINAPEGHVEIEL